MSLSEFTIIPILGSKNSVLPNDISLFRRVVDNTYLTHDTAGINVDYTRKRNACSKALGYNQWSNTATVQATKCMGIFELKVADDKDTIYFDNGKVYVYDNSFDPQEKTDSGATLFLRDDEDFYTIIKVGKYMVFTDNGGHTPYKWKHGDSALTKLIQSGTEYRFKFIESFQRRVIGAYCIEDTDAPDISIRWSSDWPTTAITSMNYPSGNQLYIPNDDTIVGIRRMGRDRCYVYSESSIHSIDYQPNYSVPFTLRNVVDGQGAVNNASIINLGDRHFLYNENYGFCEFRGGSEFPFRGRPISYDIEGDLKDVDPDYANLIVGDYVPFNREVVWTVPLNNASAQTHLLFYNIDTGGWRKQDIAARVVTSRKAYDRYTWEDFADELEGANPKWSQLESDEVWTDYNSESLRLSFGNTDGHLYYLSGETISGDNIDGYRIEPVLDFGDPYRVDILEEIWFSIGNTGAYSIDVYHRGGNTVGELIGSSWVKVGDVTCDSPKDPVVRVGNTNRLHQIKWGTDNNDEYFEVNGITFKFAPGGSY